jgi:hypothetical protein
MADYRRASKRNAREYYRNNRDTSAGMPPKPQARANTIIDMERGPSGAYFESRAYTPERRSGGSVPSVPLNKGSLSPYSGGENAWQNELRRAAGLLGRFNPYLGLGAELLSLALSEPDIEMLPVGTPPQEVPTPAPTGSEPRQSYTDQNGNDHYLIAVPPDDTAWNFLDTGRYFDPATDHASGYPNYWRERNYKTTGEGFLNTSGTYDQATVDAQPPVGWTNIGGNTWQYTMWQWTELGEIGPPQIWYDAYRKSGAWYKYYGSVTTPDDPANQSDLEGWSPQYAESSISFADAQANWPVSYTIPGSVSWAPLPREYGKSMRVPYKAISALNRLKVQLGTRIEIKPLPQDWYGATPGQAIAVGPEVTAGDGHSIPPRNPTVTTGALYPHKPPKGTKEKKGAASGRLIGLASKLFHGVTEYGDLVDALFDALPKSLQKGVRKDPASRSLQLYLHAGDIDIGDAIVNIVWNEIEDRIIGAGFGLNARAAIARGDPHAFRTLNSINDVGGIDELGKMYGDIVKDYVNPTKDQVKDYLTKHYGI